jgi:hypothetical protein
MMAEQRERKVQPSAPEFLIGNSLKLSISTKAINIIDLR